MITGTGTRAVDVVGMFDAHFQQLFVNARPLKAMLTESSKVMEHPTETGSVITDHRVIEPIEIELTMMVSTADFRDVYAQMKTTFLKAELLIVQTRTASYSNMLLYKMPHDEVADIAEGYAIALNFREVQLVSAQFQALPPRAVASGAGNGKNVRNVSTVKRGEQNGKPEQGNKSSLLYKKIYGKN